MKKCCDALQVFDTSFSHKFYKPGVQKFSKFYFIEKAKRDSFLSLLAFFLISFNIVKFQKVEKLYSSFFSNFRGFKNKEFLSSIKFFSLFFIFFVFLNGANFSAFRHEQSQKEFVSKSKRKKKNKKFHAQT